MLSISRKCSFNRDSKKFFKKLKNSLNSQIFVNDMNITREVKKLLGMIDKKIDSSNLSVLVSKIQKMLPYEPYIETIYTLIEKLDDDKSKYILNYCCNSNDKFKLCNNVKLKSNSKLQSFIFDNLTNEDVKYGLAQKCLSTTLLPYLHDHMISIDNKKKNDNDLHKGEGKNSLGNIIIENRGVLQPLIKNLYNSQEKKSTTDLKSDLINIPSKDHDNSIYLDMTGRSNSRTNDKDNKQQISTQKLLNCILTKTISFNDRNAIIDENTPPRIPLKKRKIDNTKIKSILKTSNVSSEGEYVDKDSVERSSKKFRKDISHAPKLSYSTEKILNELAQKKEEERNAAEKLCKRSMSLKCIFDDLDIEYDTEAISQMPATYNECKNINMSTNNNQCGIFILNPL